MDINSQENSIINTKLDQMLQSTLPALGIDLGGTKISCGLVSNYKLASEPKQYKTPKGSANILDQLYKIIEEYKAKNLIAGVGVATAGIVDTTSGTVIDSTFNLPGWAGTNIKQYLEPKTMLPIHVENDANAAAYGEFKSKFQNHNLSTIVVTLGTGIGGGIILNGQIFHGENYAAGEIGHLKISFENKRLCTCGHFDCWEAYGSGPGLLKTTKELLSEVNSSQSVLYENINDLSTSHIIQAIENNDFLAKKAFDLWHHHISIGLVTIAQILNPKTFIISGGMSPFVNYTLLQEMVIDKALAKVAQNLEIHQSRLGIHAGIIGAGQIALDAIILPKNY